MKKDKLLKECALILKTPKVSKWYTETLTGKSQAETINLLEKAVSENALTLREALSIALIVGFQWNVKFQGVA